MSQPQDFTISLDSPATSRAAAIEALVERVGWIAAGVILLVALAGFLGRGPLSFRQAAAEDGSLTVRYYLTERYEAPCELKIWFTLPTPEETVRLAVSRAFAYLTTAESIVPEPAGVEIQAEDIVYTFQAADIRAGSHVTYRYTNDDFGWLQYAIRLEGHPSVKVTQFVLP